jgi:hypothetical protein
LAAADDDGNKAMLRVRTKANGRIVEILPDGSVKTLDHTI